MFCRNRWIVGAILVLATPLAVAHPVLAEAVFTSEATVYYNLGARTQVTNQAQINYTDQKTVTTFSPLDTPAMLSGSVGGTQGGGNNSAQAMVNTALVGSAGLMRASVDGSGSATWITGAALADGRVNGFTVRVGWKDAYIVTGDPSNPQFGRPLIVQAFLNVSGGMSSEVNGVNAQVGIQLKLSALDELNRNLLAVAPAYSGAFAAENNLISPGFNYTPRPAPGTVPLTLMAFEGQASMMNMLMELIGGANASTNNIGLAQPRSSSFTFNADYGHTIEWGGITSVKDANTGEDLDTWSIVSASGFDYANPAVVVPTPSTAAVTLIVAVGFAARRRVR